MKRSTARWSTALAAAALLTLPVGAVAQTPGSQQPEPQQPTTQQPTTQQPTAGAHAQHDQHGSPQEHIRKAEAALNDIPATSLTGAAKTRVAELKRHINAIERAAAANDKASETGAASRDDRASAPRGKDNWSTEVAAADKILTELLATPATSAGSEATGTTGTTGSTKSKPASIALDEETRAKLMEVRTHLTAFAAAMSGSPSPSSTGAAAGTSSAQPSSAPTTGSTPSTSATTATGSPASATGSATNSGQTGNVTGTEQPPTMSTSGAQQPARSASGQVDAEAAKQHLTAARNSLSQLTQLPAASQLTGESRTQVSQLISNFNELITTDTEWRASYEKVNANLTALIGAQTTDESTTTPTSSTAGAVGTTGTSAGSLDPAIREKLMEFRTHLQQFEKAAGGAGAGMPETGASSTANPGSMTNPGATPNPTGSAYPSSPTTSTPGTTPEQSAGAAQSSSQQGSGSQQGGSQQTTQAGSKPSEEQGHGEAMRHVAAIEAILNGQPGAASPSSTPSTSAPTGTTGSTAAGPATLDRAQIEQIRTHLAELRKLLNEADRK